MSTRAVYSFFCSERRAPSALSAPHHVYKHSDGYPEGAYEAISNALEFAWKLPRYEHNEFAAAFVTGNKSYYLKQLLEAYSKPERTKQDSENIKYLEEMHREGYSGGGVRLIVADKADTPANEVARAFAGDIEYRYEIRYKNGELHVTAFETGYEQAPPLEREIFAGTLAEMKAWIGKDNGEAA